MNTGLEALGETVDVQSEFMPEFPLTVGNSPFNVKLLDMNSKNLVMMKPVTSLDTFDGATTNFHEDGLFSVSIFGRVGSTERSRRFSYIDLRTEIIHPYIWIALNTIRSLYVEILAGKSYAIWNQETKNFDRATELDGETGYSFFMSHWAELTIPRGKSDNRNTYIEAIEKFRGKGDVLSKLPVTPAGIRDVEIDKNKRVTKDEVNDLYYRAIAVSNTIVPNVVVSTPRILDTSRNSLQNVINEIYLHYEGMCKGKRGIFQRSLGGRTIFNGTRNVITAMDTSTTDLDSPRSPSPLYTQIGLYQLLKGALPVAKYHLKNGWLSQVFVDGTPGAYLVDPKTLKRKLVAIQIESADRWTTDEGLDKVITKFSKPAVRQQPIMVEGYYIGLIYVDEHTFKIFGDIDELPSNLDRRNVHPLTYTQLLYLCGYAVWNKLITMITRYPVAGLGSTYTTYVYCRTTIVASQKWERGFDWGYDNTELGALEFPDLADDAPFVDSLIPHSVALEGLVAD